MPTRQLVSVLTFVTLLALSAAVAQKPERKLQEVFAPYWTSEPGWDTELQLKNNLSSAPLTVTPILRLAAGEEIPLDPVTIASNASVSVWVNEGLLKHAPSVLNAPGSYGSVVFRFTSLNAMNLYATVVPSMQGEPIAFPVRARPTAVASVESGNPGSLEGIWWQPRTGLKDILAISNSSERKINGTLSLFDASGKRWSQPLPLSPHQTQRMAVGDLLQKAGLSGSYGGIKLDVPTSALAVGGVHFMYDEVSKFSEALEMVSRDPSATIRTRTGSDAKQWTTRAPMLALSVPDPEAGMPAGTVLQPMIFVRNTTARNISADIALNWRGDAAKGQARLPGIQLAPFATKQLLIGAMQEQLGIAKDAHWTLVTLTTNALPDDLIAAAVSRDATGRYHLDTNFSGTVTARFTGGEWRYDANHNHIISVTNSGQKPTEALVTLHYDNGGKSYEMQQTVQPGDQIAVNVSELIRNRVSDHKGNVLPADLTFGTYDVRDLGSGPGSLSVDGLALDKTYGYQAAPPSPDCCGFGSPLLSPDSAFVDIGGFESIGATATYQCTGDSESIFDSMTTWWSGNSAIAQVTKGQATGVSAGTTTANASGKILECSGNTEYFQLVEPSAPVTVTAVPVNFRLTSASDDGGGVEVLLDSFFSWQSSDGKLGDLSSCSMRENTTYPSTNNSACTVNGVNQTCYFPPSPPWSASSQSGSGYPNPTSPPPGPATGGTSEDQNTVANLNFVKPYSVSSFPATQYVQYSCASGPWTNLYGPITITRSITKNASGKWVVTASRSDTQVTSTYVIPNQ